MPTVQFNYTGATQSWVVPSNTTLINVRAMGGNGANYSVTGGSLGGGGARVSGNITVTPGQTIYIYVGGHGNNNGSGGWNGGGSGFRGGGGASDVRVGGTTVGARVLVAGGGGGAALHTGLPTRDGGDGSGPTGQSGEGSGSGGGGTQTAGGAAGGAGASAGTISVGGTGATDGGGGGAGRWSGGGGSNNYSGGGGASYIGGVQNGAYSASGLSSGTNGGVVVIDYEVNQAPTAPTLTGPAHLQAIPSTNAINFSWTFNDPDPNDTQQNYELRYRIIGAPSYTTLSGTTATTRQIGAGVLPDGNYEWSVRTNDGLLWGPWAANRTFSIYTLNSPPNTPSLVQPANNATLPENQTFRFEWTFSDPDPGDTQSKVDLQFGEQGSQATTFPISGPQTFVDYSGGLSSGDWQWRVRVYDQSNAVSSYSNWGFFSTTTPPAAPNITAPTNNQTIANQSFNVTWSASSQQAYELRRVADSSGSADVNTVYYTTGVVNSTNARSRVIDFPTNDRYEHVQLRIQSDGVWSVWASRRVHVSYVPPAIPTLSTTGNSAQAFVRLHVLNPPRSGSEPLLSHNVVYRRRAGTSDSWQKLGEIGESSNYTDYEVPSGVQYQYRVDAVGVNTAASTNTIGAVTIQLTEWRLKDLDTPTDSIIVDVVNDTLNLTHPVDQAKFNPLGRKHPIIVSDILKSENFSITLEFIGGAAIKAFCKLRDKQKTLLLQAPLMDRQWYVWISGEVNEEILNLEDPWVRYTIEVQDVGRPGLYENPNAPHSH
jgi:hypothetical protein